jgi:flavin-dependent dehydrogenase
MVEQRCDVAIIGGGPAGATVGALLMRYDPTLQVTILEREKFPRDHVGESHLPAISPILHEMGAWDKIEAAEFPIKIGGTYRWGATEELWDLDFLNGHEFQNLPRPNPYSGQRLHTAFQVDRSVYDQILLDHAEQLGCRVRQQTAVSKVHNQGDKITGLGLKPSHSSTGDEAETLVADYYVDCSGDAGAIRRALQIPCQNPTILKNIAVWDYWQDAEWAVTLGKGGTRIQVLSLTWGWLWFIPVSPTRTSVGLVVPVEYYKASGATPKQLYERAIQEDALVARLVSSAKCENALQATKDWSFVADRMVGENWFLAGDSGGFADPILSAGMTLAHTAAKKVAYSILELKRGRFDPQWIKDEYHRQQRNQIDQHIKFADFWYSSNGRFTDLQEYCSTIAAEAGLELNATDAFRWLATGGFAVQEPGLARALGFRVIGLKRVAQLISGEAPPWAVTQTNLWLPNLKDVKQETLALYVEGEIKPVACYRRNGKVLPLTGAFAHAMTSIREHSYSKIAFAKCVDRLIDGEGMSNQDAILQAVETFEALLTEGWIKGKRVEGQEFLTFQ